MTPARRPRKPSAALPPLAGLDAKRWAKRAAELQFTSLADVRATAGNWRTGLAGLTSLLTVTAIAVAPSLADKLDSWWRIAAGILALAGLLVLLYGTWQAMSAAFGVPGEAKLMTGERLRAWEFGQAVAGASALRRARVATLAGLALLIATTAVVLSGAVSTDQPRPLVRIDSGDVSFCGHLGKTDPAKIAVVGDDGTVHAVPIRTVTAAAPVSEC